MKRGPIIYLIACLVAIATGAALAGEPAPRPQQIATATTPTSAQTDNGYRLGTGDKIRVIVYGEDDLSGEFQVDGSGTVRLPLIGQVNAAGRTVRDFEGDVTAKLADGYLRSPRVSVEVTNYRPFFILGEVNKPGEYPYVNGMNVVTAVALAGGYTYRADESDVYVRRNGQPEKEVSADERTQILPGDIVRVAERFF
jgi:protein involved in polysaccharide export with SLBB domain